MTTEFSLSELDDVLDGIRESASEPSPGVMENASTSDDDATTDAPSLGDKITDTLGRVFDPEQYAVDADGKPSLTKTGRFRKKRTTSKVADIQGAQQQQLSDQAQREQSRMLGYKAADTMFGLGVMLGGEDWKPQGAEDFKADLEINEYNQIRRAFADAAEAGQWKVSPNTFLMFALAGYAAPRLIASEETHKRLGLFARFIKPKLTTIGAWFKGFRKGKKNAAQSNSRNERKRENDTSKDDGTASESERTRGAGA